MKANLFACVCGLLLSGCAASAREAYTPSAATREAPLPSSPGEAAAELAHLERVIENGRDALGLGGRQEAAPPYMPAASAAGAAAEPSAADGDGERTPGEEAASEARASSPASAGLGSEDAPPTCSEPCKLTHAICRAAERICVIAAYLGDAASAERCHRARQDCDAAQAATRGQRCGTCQ